MKALLSFLTVILFSNLSNAQAQIQWQNSLGGTDIEQIVSIQQTSDGGYITVGHSFSNDGDVTVNNGDMDYWIVKLSSAGTITWQKSLGGTGVDAAFSIQQTSDGGYIIAGSSNSIDGDVTGNHGGRDYWIVKLTSTGTITWQKSLGGSSHDYARSIQQTTDGGFIVTGMSASNDGDVTGNNGDFDYWVVKLTSTGTITWQKSLGGTLFESAQSIQQTSDGGYIIAGQSGSNDGDVASNQGNYDCWIVKLTSTGTITWEESFGGTFLESTESIQQTTDGGFIVAGYSNSNDGDITASHGNGDFWILKLSNTGTLIWEKSLGGTGIDNGFSIQQTTDGGYIVAGYSNSIDGDVTGNHGDFDYWIAKLTNLGVITWQKSIGGNGIDDAFSIQQTSDGGYVIAGHSNSNNGDVTGNNGNTDSWVVKLSSSVGIYENSFSNLSIFPNPTNRNISIDLGELQQDLKATVTNSLGQVVLTKNYKSTNRINFDLATPKGIYFLQIEIDGEIISKKIIKK